MVSMRDVRQTVRNLLLRHPVGERWVVPALQSAYDRLPFQDWRAKRYAATEGRRLLRLMGRGTEVFTIVYGGLSYGSLCYTFVPTSALAARTARTRVAHIRVTPPPSQSALRKWGVRTSAADMA